MARPRKNPKFVTKICEGCQKEFTVLYKKLKQRFCNKSCVQNSPHVQEKIKKAQVNTFRERYGADHPMKTEKCVINFKKSMVDKYGVEHALQNPSLLKKVKTTKLQKYGDENYNNFEQLKQTCLEKYGVENYVYTEEYKTKLKEFCLNKYGTEFFPQTDTFKQKHYENMFEKIENDEDFKNFTPLFSIDDYKGVTYEIQKYKFKCKRCDNVELYDLSDGKRPSCINCDKLNSSREQKEIYDFLKESLGNDVIIIMNEKTILYPKEIDIYLPSFNVAIEYNSLYWHSEISGRKNKIYHLNKTKACLSKGLTLIHVYQHEWLHKKNIVKSILLNLFNKTREKVYARNCEVKIVDRKECDSFLLENHIQGPDNSSIKLGLYYGNKLISVMTFGKSRYDKNVEYEMYRFCNLLNTNIVGGASKLFSHFVKKFNPKTIVSYSDRRYFDGTLYLTLGFVFVKNTSPNYHYIATDYRRVKSRMQFQKHKLQYLLENFNSTLTEWENMKNNGFDRIWDCGNGKWIWSAIQRNLSN